jgi:hypothetical protein
MICRLAVLACLLVVLPAAACPLRAPALQAGTIHAAWTVDNGTPIRVGHHFVLNVQLCPVDAVLARVDAVMPEHGHGMNYRPSVTAISDGRWRAEGLLFQMPGSWELRLDVQTAGGTERLRQTIMVP